MTAHRIIQGDVLKGLACLPDQSIHCVVTSPPYWGLRAYGTEPQVWGGDPACPHSWESTHPPGYRSSDTNPGPLQSEGSKGRDRFTSDICVKCGAWKGELGLEPTPEMYVQHLVTVFREVRRVLRADGTAWVNMGDCYASSANGRSAADIKRIGNDDRTFRDKPFNTAIGDLKEKDLVGMPWLLAFALRADGWYLRSDIVWSKPNPMPESVVDRPTKSHEYLFLLSRSARYFYDQDAVREKNTLEIVTREDAVNNVSNMRREGKENDASVRLFPIRYCHPAGRNRRTVWEIPTQPFPEAHFATFPEALVEPCIKAGTSERGCCPKCGSPWERVVKVHDPEGRLGKGYHDHEDDLVRGQRGVFSAEGRPTRETVRWEPSCSCDLEPVPCVVIDPFAGSGTVAMVARSLGRSSVSIELNPAYVEMIKKRMRFGEQLFPGQVTVEAAP